MKPTIGRIVHVYGPRADDPGQERPGPYAAIVTSIGLPGQMIGVTIFNPSSVAAETARVVSVMAISFLEDDAGRRPDGWFATWPVWEVV